MQSHSENKPPFHRRDLIKLEENTSFQEAVRDHLSTDPEDTLLLTVDREEIYPLIPEPGQEQIGAFDYPDALTVFRGEIPTQNTPDDANRYPNDSDERLHFESNSFGHVVVLFPQTDYNNRLVPVYDAMRIVRPGGNLTLSTGLKLHQPADHEPSYWIAPTDYGSLDQLRLFRTGGFKTPQLLAEYSVAETPAKPQATVVSQP